MDWMAQYGEGYDDDGDDIPDFGAMLDEADREIAMCGGQHDCPCGVVFDDGASVRVNVDGLRPLHAREQHCVGQAWSNGVTSDTYIVDGVRCERDVATGAVWYEDGITRINSAHASEKFAQRTVRTMTVGSSL